MKQRSVCAVLGMLFALSACNSTDTGPALNVNQDESQNTANAPIVIKGKCPRVSLRDGTAFYRAYAKKNSTDPQDITYQASLFETTRTCSISGDQTIINVVAAGRVLAGPKGSSGKVSLPIRVAVVDSNIVLFSELKTQVVSLPQGNPTTQFLFTHASVAIPTGAAGDAQVFVGFDEGEK